jgi:acetylornithine deacetylase/succinyl-diaminopimelate desuccinylase-like protein
MLGRIGVVAAVLLVVHGTIATRAQSGISETDRRLVREILAELVLIPTTEADAATPRAAQVLADRLVAAGFPRTDVNVLGPTPQVGSLVARLRGSKAGTRPILLMAHLDVVPARREDWSFDPWTLTERDGWLYGRGSTDNKSGAAMLVANFIRLKRDGWRPERDVIVVLTGDEETNQKTIQWLLAEHRDLVDAELAFNTDGGAVVTKNGRPLLFKAQSSEKVYADYQLEVTDSGGHSSLPKSDNPISILSAALVRIGDYRFPVQISDDIRLFFERSSRTETGQLASDLKAVATMPASDAVINRLSQVPFYNARLRTTCVATRIEGGHANNALPQMARAIINCRILPGASLPNVEARLRSLAGAKVKLTVVSAPVASPPSPLPPALLGRIERLVAERWPGLPVVPAMETGATDGMYVRSAGIPTYGLSGLTEDPDDIRAHGKDERVQIEALENATQFWFELVKDFSRAQ